DQHHAFDAEIEDAGLLGDELAGCGQQERRRGADDREQDGDEPAGFGAHVAVATRATAPAGFLSRTRKRMRMSQPSRKNSRMPWKIPVTALGMPRSICAFSPPR